MPADRMSQRLPTNLPVEWAIPSLALTGHGTIRDVSAAGLCLLIDKEFRLQSGSVAFALRCSLLPQLPRKARLRWYRRPPRVAGQPPSGLLCGAVFKFESPEQENAWRSWVSASLSGRTPVQQI
jgi:hypothetical protein